MTSKTSSILFETALTLYGQCEEGGYQYIKDIFAELEKLHEKMSTAKNIEQSWISTKERLFEKVIGHLIKEEVNNLDLEIVSYSKLIRTKLNPELTEVKRKLLIDYGGEFGCHLPEADFVIYEPSARKAVAILFVKASLCERITDKIGYWKLKLYSQEITQHVKVYFVTQDINDDYVLNKIEIFESHKIKPFSQLIDDLKKLLPKS